MAKKSWARGAAKAARASSLAKRLIAPWELGILFVLLLVVFSPNIVRLMVGVAPLVPAPRPAFVYPIVAASSNFNMMLVAGQAFGVLTSPNYLTNVWTVAGVAGTMTSESYMLELGIPPLLLVPAVPSGVAWAENTTIPPSPAVYDPAQSYTFSIWWYGATDVLFEMWRDGLAYRSYAYSAGQVERKWDIVYTVTFPTLPAGEYTYRWSGFNRSAVANQTPAWGYTVSKASSVLSFTIDGEAADRLVSVGPSVLISAASSANPELTVRLMANFTGVMDEIAAGAGSVSYLLDTSLIGRGAYEIQAAIDGNENWTANSSSLMLTVAEVRLLNATVDPPSGTAYAERTHTFSVTCEGFVSDVLLELDGVNLTASRDGDTCTREVGTLGAGLYSYRWWANDTAGKWYSTTPRDYEIIKANATLELLIDGQPRSKLASTTDDPTIAVTMDIEGSRTLTIKDPSGTTVSETVWLEDVTTTLGTLGLSLSTGRWNITASFAGNANYNPARITRWIAVNMTDETAPQFSNVMQSSDMPGYGGFVSLSADVSDDVLIDWMWLETNMTGAWENLTPAYSGAPFESASFALQAMAPPETAVGWRIWANDTTGRVNGTDAMTFTVAADTQAPAVANQGWTDAIGNTTDAMIGVGDSIELSALCSEETMLKEARLETNETGAWSNVSLLGLSGTSAWANFTWQNASIGAGETVGWSTTIGWRIWCIDYSGNAAETGEMSFIVKVFDPADTYKDGRISWEELQAAIEKWKMGLLEMADLMRAIAAWKAGRY
ncbi:MAG: hypothetical protein QXF55_01610 [Candidatus Aenigmatarchaeota archaeon]